MQPIQPFSRVPNSLCCCLQWAKHKSGGNNLTKTNKVLTGGVNSHFRRNIRKLGYFKLIENEGRGEGGVGCFSALAEQNKWRINILKYKPLSGPACGKWPSVTWMWPMQSCLFTLSNILVLQKEQVWLNWHRQGVEESKAGWIWSPHPKFCWFQTSVQPWPAARPLVPGCADTTHSLQFPPKEAEMANIIACNSFLACQGVNLWD